MEPLPTHEPPHPPSRAGRPSPPPTGHPPAPAGWADLYATPVGSHLLRYCGTTILLVAFGYAGRLLGTLLLIPGLACLLAITLTTDRRLAEVWRHAVPRGAKVPGEVRRVICAAVVAVAAAGAELLFAALHDVSATPWWAIVAIAAVFALVIELITTLITKERQVFLRGLERAQPRPGP